MNWNVGNFHAITFDEVFSFSVVVAGNSSSNFLGSRSRGRKLADSFTVNYARDSGFSTSARGGERVCINIELH